MKKYHVINLSWEVIMEKGKAYDRFIEVISSIIYGILRRRKNKPF